MRRSIKDNCKPALLLSVREALAKLPGIELRAVEEHLQLGDRSIDLLITADVKGQPVCLAVEAKAAGFPRDARAATWQFERISDVLRERMGSTPVFPFFVAPSVSQRARALLRERDIGYWDASGSLYLELPRALYAIDRPSPPGAIRPSRAIYRGRAAQVLHALLLDPGRSWHGHELAMLAEVSPYTVHQVFDFLEAQLWVEKRGKGPGTVRVLREPGALLDAWASEHSLAIYRPYRYHRWARDFVYIVLDVANALVVTGIEHAVTLAAGALRVAPFVLGLDQMSVLIADPGRLDQIAPIAELKPVDEGENVTFLATRERWPLMFRRQVDSVWVASDVQLYLDLWASPARGKEQARHLRAERLGY